MVQDSRVSVNHQVELVQGLHIRGYRVSENLAVEPARASNLNDLSHHQKLISLTGPSQQLNR